MSIILTNLYNLLSYLITTVYLENFVINLNTQEETQRKNVKQVSEKIVKKTVSKRVADYPLGD